MNTNQYFRRILLKGFVPIGFLAAFVIVSCLPRVATQLPEPTVDIGAIYTHAVETALYQFSVLSTQTALAIPTETPTITPTSTLPPTSTIPPTATSIWSQVDNASCVPNNELENARVVEIIDGDTIKVLLQDKVYSLRYIGIDTPEKNGEFYSQEATLKNAELVAGKDIILVKDVSEKDPYGRLLRYVISGNIFVNFELVQNGYARATSYPPDSACDVVFQSGEQLAKTSLIGIWQLPTQVPIVQNTPSSGTNRQNCSPAYPTVCIPPPPPDLDCKDIPYRNFQVLPPDPHRFDGDKDGIGCES